MSDLDPEELRSREERGIAAALFFLVSASVERWPGLEDINVIHHLIFNGINPHMAGQYRKDTFEPQYIRYSVPHWRDVPTCMMRLRELMERAKVECDRLTEDHRVERVVEWTAGIHHRFERIHPFEDGNGRTGRALAS